MKDKKDFISRFLKYIKEKEKRIPYPEKLENWFAVEKEAKSKIRRRMLNRVYLAVTVSAALLAGVVFYLRHDSVKKVDLKDLAATMAVEAASDQIMLHISSGKSIAIKDSSTVNYSEAGNVAVDDQINVESPEQDDNTEYHKIFVPQGKRTILILADNSKIWVNSRTKVIYPHRFTGKTREIYVDGEIYCEISHHEKWPFIVKTPNNFEVEVLGTSFNICTYGEQAVSSVVLAEGRVSVTDKNHKKTWLLPNQLINIDSEGLGAKRIVDASDYISWTKGFLNIHSETLESVIQRLEMYFNIKINIESQSLKTVKISGKMVLMDSPDEILSGLSNLIPISYTKNNNAYVIEAKR
ncbi:FecR family protein [Parabacteroides sp. Marseille-P3160]|uniref:FecR family protein n=1 Tax=Parabacteroides sp. Marseille-P3160 TaxID=1917887 RepID=UPI0013581057|nr:FecR domain-containing protein [Parabacteroides sp. Marseille-P3160]